MMNETLNGVVQFFNTKKKIGMIKSDDHIYFFTGGDTKIWPEEGERVIFEERQSVIQTNHKVLFAQNVRRQNGTESN